MIDIQLTPNFRLSEFVVSDTANKLPSLKVKQELISYDILANIIEVAHKLQRVRDHLGVSIFINSGYRCPELNRKVKGVGSSAHLKGLAVDITTNGFILNEELFKACKILDDYDQIICYGSPIRFIHLGFTLKMTPRKQIIQRP